MMNRIKRWIWGCSAFGLLLGGTVWAGTITSTKSQVNTQYLAGNITDIVFRDNMILNLNDAKYANTCSEMKAVMDSFRIVVEGAIGNEINQDGADAVLNESQGVEAAAGCP